MQNYCSVTRAYEIADNCMLEQFLAHSTCEEDGWRMTDEPARDAARWLIARGMAKADRGFITLVEHIVSEDEG